MFLADAHKLPRAQLKGILTLPVEEVLLLPVDGHGFSHAEKHHY
ncbi:MAG TPA: hypothetical protein VGG46_15730 [Terriglobales bacterium]